MSESRKYTQAQKLSAKKWDAANLDRISIALPKGGKDAIKAAAVAARESMNQYVINAIDQRKEQDTLPKDVIFGRAVDVIANHYEVSPWDVLDKLEGLRSTESQSGASESALGGGVVSLPYETLEAAQRAAEAAGEDIPQFIERAIQGQAERDVDSRIAEVSATNMLLDKLKSGELSGKNRSIAEEYLLARGVDPYTGERLQKEA